MEESPAWSVDAIQLWDKAAVPRANSQLGCCGHVEPCTQVAGYRVAGDGLR